MKKLIFLVFTVFFGFPLLTSALSPEDQAIGNKILMQILDDTDNGTDRTNLVERYYVVKDMESQVASGSLRDKLRFVEDELRHFIDGMKDDDHALKVVNEVNFLTHYGSGVNYSGHNMTPSCFEHEMLIDDLARGENLAPSLVAATWMMETSCNMYYPGNGDGPFQILSKDVRGEMTLPKFVNEFQDFAAFVRKKRDWYDNANAGSGLTVSLPYTGLNYTGLVRHGSLYNGLSGAIIIGDIMPGNPHYVRGRYNDAYSGSNKDGLLKNVLRFIRGNE